MIDNLGTILSLVAILAGLILFGIWRLKQKDIKTPEELILDAHISAFHKEGRNPNDKFVIGVLGENASGKGTFSSELIGLVGAKQVTRVSSGGVLVEMLESLGGAVPATRENLQKLAILLDQTFGEGTLSRAVARRIKKAPTRIVIFDGVRWRSDVKMIRQFARFTTVYITADIETRFARARRRNEKVNEEDMTLEEFVAAEQVKTETQIPEIGRNAEWMFINDGAPEDMGAFAKAFVAGSLIKASAQTAP